LNKNSNINNANNDSNKKNYKNNKNTDLEESETFLRNSSNSTTNSGNKLTNKNENPKPAHLKVPKLSGLNNGIKNESEPKKMQAERSPLLKDLSQSKLLNKFKTEEINSPNLESTLDKINETGPTTVDAVKNTGNGGVYGEKTAEIDSGVYFGSSQVSKNSEQKQSEICSKNDSNSLTKSELKNIIEEEQQQRDEYDQTNLKSSKTEPILEVKVPEIIDSKEIINNTHLTENDNSKTLNTENNHQPITSNNELSIEEENCKSVIYSEENLGIISGMTSIIDDTENMHESRVSLTNTTPRKTKFNPQHVILKDKNKYYTTEYV
jgi:hypothetical protein